MLSSNRQSKKIIEVYGIRVSPHSKFYLWNDMFYEPCYYRKKKTGTYKPVKESHRVYQIEDFINRKESITKVSDGIRNKILKNNKKKCKKVVTIFELMDI
jgi:hypothetical protein